jgi:hypothetical protein
MTGFGVCGWLIYFVLIRLILGTLDELLDKTVEGLALGSESCS